MKWTETSHVTYFGFAKFPNLAKLSNKHSIMWLWHHNLIRVDWSHVETDFKQIQIEVFNEITIGDNETMFHGMNSILDQKRSSQAYNFLFKNW